MDQPIKLRTVICRTRLAKSQSATTRPSVSDCHELAGSARFCGFTCMRKLTVSTKVPTVEINPARNALNGKVPTTIQYANCTMPVINTARIYASITLRYNGTPASYPLFKEPHTDFGPDPDPDPEDTDDDAMSVAILDHPREHYSVTGRCEPTSPSTTRSTICSRLSDSSAFSV
ncbi:hypothetical protein FVE85_8277 [Porphyridium purpureum]|uniref:Uncharacterized protein n=1 Tax=Porphyridium purpureum TaxID=35688 RepID=A0A5J4YKY8_PORPP|nr:hypothetical protein FVE85_8277 [Porphyridium purpureum]|eukprot:POR0926..scf244_11